MTTPPPSRGFDQVVKGNVDIKQLSKKKYKITFSEIGDFLMYQVWSDSSNTQNNDRKVGYVKAKKWINDFNSSNALKALSKPLFTPTTVMEISNKKYLFVIHEAKLNGKGHVVFKVSTEEIKLSEKKMLKLPCGYHDGVRFYIDYDGDLHSRYVDEAVPNGLKNGKRCWNYTQIEWNKKDYDWYTYAKPLEVRIPPDEREGSDGPNGEPLYKLDIAGLGWAWKCW